MTAQIKITQLTEIGSANINNNTLLPVVNMAGVPTTQKTTLGNLANVILSQSGANYATVAVANLSYSVANAAQPNITSTGTLASLSVSGNANIGNLKVNGTSNLGAIGNITVTGGTSGQVLTTDGTGSLSWTTVSGGGNYSNSNVANYLPTYSGNIGASYVNAQNINVTNRVLTPNILSNSTLSISVNGNVTTFQGNGDIDLPSGARFTDSAFLASPNSQVILGNNTGVVKYFVQNDGAYVQTSDGSNTFISVFQDDGDLAISGNLVFPSGSRAGEIAGNSSMGIAAASNHDLVFETSNGSGGHQWVLDSSGNFILGDGVIKYSNGLVYGSNFTGNITFTDTTISTTKANSDVILAGFSNGNVKINANSRLWNFQANGRLSFPDNTQMFGNNNSFHIASGNVTIAAGPNANASLSWIFKGNGNLEFPDTTVQNTAWTGNVAGANVIGEVANANYAMHVDVEPTTNNYSYHVVLVQNPGDNHLQLDGDDQLQYNPSSGTLNTVRLDADILNITGTVVSNLIPFSNISYDLGNNTNRWKDIYLANSTIYLGDATLSANGNSIVVDSITVTNGNVGTIGNVASLNLDGSNSNVLYGNGVFAPGGGGGSSISNGTSNVSIPVSNGNVEVTAGTQHWAFGTDGTLTLPNDANIATIGNVTQFNSCANGFLGLNTYDAGSNNIARIGISSADGLVAIGVSDPVTEIDYNWFFANGGGTIFPTLTVDLHNGGNQTAQTLQFGDPSQQAIITGPTPAANVNAQRLIIQGQRGNGTGEGGDVYFWAGDADTNGGDIKIYAGDADNVSTGSGGYINLDGGSGFDGGGQISVTGGYSTGGVGGPVYISAGQGANGGVVNINGGGASANAGGYVNIQGGFGQSDGGAVTIAGGGSALGLPGYGNVQITAGVSTWTFDNTGNLVLAGGSSVIQSIANSSLDPTLPNVSTMTLTPDSNYNSQVLVLDPTAPGHIHLRAYAYSNIDEPAANIFLGGENTSFEVTQGANNQARIHSGGNTWTFDNGGNLVTPGLTGTYIKSAPGGYMGLAAINDGGDQPAQLVSINSNLGLGTTAISVYANNAMIQSNINGTIQTWNFDSAGNITLPGNTFAVNYANGTQVSLGGGVAEASFNIQTANFNAVVGSRYGVDTTTGAVTATLPASPATGVAIFFADAGGAFASNNLIIDPNGGTIMGASGNMTVSTNNQCVGVFYNGATWRTYNIGY